MSTLMFSPDLNILSSSDKTNSMNLSQSYVNSVSKEYDLDMCIDWIEMQRLEKVCLQFPDNLLKDATNISIYLKKKLKRDVYILGDTSYGSCCIDDVAAKHVNADGIIHFGHTCLSPTTRLPVLHILQKNKIDVNQFCEEFCRYFHDESLPIILFYDVAYAHGIEEISEILSKNHKKLIVTQLNCKSNIPYVDANESKSAILGRCYKLDEEFQIQEYHAVFIGPNNKTLINMSVTISADKWHFYDCESKKLEKVEFLNSPWIKRRRYMVEKLKDARTVGIVVATLGIIDYLKAIKYIKQTLKKVNKKTYILSVGKINPAKLANFAEIDAFVIIACPDSEIFDSKDFIKPLLMPFEVDLAFNTNRELSTHHCMDFRQILEGGLNHMEFKKSLEQTDISLITGSLKNLSHDDTNDNFANEMKTLSCRSKGVVAIGSSGANFLMERTWQGLDQRLGKDPIQETIEKGRSGLPIGYENETNILLHKKI